MNEVREEQRGEQNDGLWRRNTYYFFLHLAGFLIIFFLKAGTSHCMLFVDDDSSRELHDPSFSGCDTPFWVVCSLLDCIFEVDGRCGSWGDGEHEFHEHDCGCLGGISRVCDGAQCLISEAGGNIFGVLVNVVCVGCPCYWNQCCQQQATFINGQCKTNRKTSWSAPVVVEALLM